MGIIAWIVVGLVAGFIGSKIVNKSGKGLMIDMTLGVIGGFLGGEIFQAFGFAGVSGINLWSILVAVIGSCIDLTLYHGIVHP
jgi:uncharacterized membrane protein YeaQ/YmgE (transglycosylase-associated protein family)